MAITEQDRHHLFARLETVLGPQEATTLMEHLPPVGWADVATRHDLDELRKDLHHEISSVHAELTNEISSVRHEISGLRAELTNEIGSVRHEISSVRGELGALEIRLEAKLDRSAREQIHTLLFANLGYITLLASVLVAAIRL